MRKTDREIKNFDEIIDILRRAETIRLGINGNPYPYVVPVSFGFEVVNGVVIIYFHGAKEGFKHELLAKDNHVCVEADIFHRYLKLEHGISVEYESVIGFGTAEIVHGEEAVRGMALALEHCGFGDYNYDLRELENVHIYKITLPEITGKRRKIP
ncbi:MAG: pyridoxamine 5'-phosphate oxidase family protein [Oscillospiraceae bacterium]|nr:pyridoxamine 5'-phosphate oxidase family protein [Oscillospiraceae bacterium]